MPICGSIVVHPSKGLTTGGAVCAEFAPIVVVVVAAQAALATVNSTVVAVVAVVVIVVVVVGGHAVTVFRNLSIFHCLTAITLAHLLEG